MKSRCFTALPIAFFLSCGGKPDFESQFNVYATSWGNCFMGTRFGSPKEGECKEYDPENGPQATYLVETAKNSADKEEYLFARLRDINQPVKQEAAMEILERVASSDKLDSVYLNIVVASDDDVSGYILETLLSSKRNGSLANVSCKIIAESDDPYKIRSTLNRASRVDQNTFSKIQQATKRRLPKELDKADAKSKPPKLLIELIRCSLNSSIFSKEEMLGFRKSFVKKWGEVEATKAFKRSDGE